MKPTQKEAILKHLRELTADAEIYGWEPLRAFHAIWLQQLVNGKANWGDEDKKLEFRRALVWNLVHHMTSLKAQPTASHQQR